MNLRKILLGAVAVAVASPVIAYHVFLKEKIDFTVNRSEFVVNGDYSRYLVWADRGDNVEVLKNTNSWLALKFETETIFAAIPVGAECRATVAGVRMPFLNIHRNILSVNCK